MIFMYVIPIENLIIIRLLIGSKKLVKFFLNRKELTGLSPSSPVPSNDPINHAGVEIWLNLFILVCRALFFVDFVIYCTIKY